MLASTKQDQSGRHDRGSSGSSFGAFSRDEMNLAEFPLAALSTRVDPSVKTLEFSDTQRLKNGELAKREWIITGADKFGLPTSTDDDVILGLIRLTMDHGFRSRKVHFTRYELMQILRWAPEGRNYTRLTKSLDRLSGVRIKATNAFFDNSSKSFQTCNFGIIDAYEIVDGRNSKAAADAQQSYFIWSEVLFDSFKSGFIKKLDLNLYFSLKSAVSRRLYRYLDKHFYFRPVVERPLMVLAFEKLGLSRSYRYVSSIKQQLEPAFEELISIGFLTSYEYAGRGEGTAVRLTGASQPGAGQLAAGRSCGGSSKSAGASGKPAGFSSSAFFQRTAQNSAVDEATPGPELQRSAIDAANGHFGRNAANQGKPSGAEPLAFQFDQARVARPPQTPVYEDSLRATAETSADGNQLERHLLKAVVGRGLSPDQARRLVQGRGQDELRRIHQIIGYYDFLLLTSDQRVSKSPVGFLYRALENPSQFTVPANYSDSGHVASSGGSSSGSSAASSFGPQAKLRSGQQRERLGKLRPELRIVRAGRQSGQPQERAGVQRITVEEQLAKALDAARHRKE